MNHINSNIRFLRTHHRYSQAEFAKILGITQGMVKSYEGSLQTTPPLDTAMKISDEFNVSIDSLVRVELNSTTYEALKKRDKTNANKRLNILELESRVSVLEEKIKNLETERLEKP